MLIGAESADDEGSRAASPTLADEVYRLRERLSTAGTDEASLLAVDAFIDAAESPGAVDEIRDELANLLPETAHPVVSVVPVSALGGAKARLQAIAVPQGRSLLSDGARFPSAARRGEYFALTSAAAAAGILEQSRESLAQVASLLAALGTSPEDVLLVDVEYLVGNSPDEWEKAALARAQFFSEPGPCATGITLTRVAAPGGQIQFRMLGVVGARARGEVQEAWPNRPWTWPFRLPYRHGNRVGDLIVVGGQSSRGPNGSAMRGEDVSTQATETVHSVASVLEELSSSLEEVRRLTAYFVGEDAEQDTVRSSIVSAMPRSRYDLSVVRVDHLAHEQMLVEVEALAWRR